MWWLQLGRVKNHQPLWSPVWLHHIFTGKDNTVFSFFCLKGSWTCLCIWPSLSSNMHLAYKFKSSSSLSRVISLIELRFRQNWNFTDKSLKQSRDGHQEGHSVNHQRAGGPLPAIFHPGALSCVTTFGEATPLARLWRFLGLGIGAAVITLQEGKAFIWGQGPVQFNS